MHGVTINTGSALINVSHHNLDIINDPKDHVALSGLRAQTRLLSYCQQAIFDSLTVGRHFQGTETTYV
jgi:hypothetical protein